MWNLVDKSTGEKVESAKSMAALAPILGFSRQYLSKSWKAGKTIFHLKEDGRQLEIVKDAEPSPKSKSEPKPKSKSKPKSKGSTRSVGIADFKYSPGTLMNIRMLGQLPKLEPLPQAQWDFIIQKLLDFLKDAPCPFPFPEVESVDISRDELVDISRDESVDISRDESVDIPGVESVDIPGDESVDIPGVESPADEPFFNAQRLWNKVLENFNGFTPGHEFQEVLPGKDDKVVLCNMHTGDWFIAEDEWDIVNFFEGCGYCKYPDLAEFRANLPKGQWYFDAQQFPNSTRELWTRTTFFKN